MPTVRLDMSSLELASGMLRGSAYTAKVDSVSRPFLYYRVPTTLPITLQDAHARGFSRKVDL